MLKIKVLIENSGTEELAGEHGLSLWIEYRGRNYLLDAGSTDLFMENALKCGIPLEKTNACILSHGHYDHSGGFHGFMERYGARQIYAMEGVRERYSSGSGGTVHDIGVPEELFRDYGSCFCAVRDEVILAEGVHLIPHSTPGLDRIGQRTKLYKGTPGACVPDDFAHELTAVFESESGLVVINSCSHGGLQVILEEVKQALPGRKIAAFIGGLHMKGRKNGEDICTFSESEIERLAEYVTGTGVRCIYTGHCTGESGFKLLQKYLGESIQPLHTGRVIEIY